MASNVEPLNFVTTNKESWGYWQFIPDPVEPELKALDPNEGSASLVGNDLKLLYRVLHDHFKDH